MLRLYRQLVSIQLCLVLRPPSFSSCTWNLLSTFFFSRSLFQVIFGRPLCLWPCSVHCIACLTMLSSFLLNMCLRQFHFLLLSRSITVYKLLVIFLHNSLSAVLSCQCLFTILCKHSLIKTATYLLFVMQLSSTRKHRDIIAIIRSLTLIIFCFFS